MISNTKSKWLTKIYRHYAQARKKIWIHAKFMFVGVLVIEILEFHRKKKRKNRFYKILLIFSQ